MNQRITVQLCYSLTAGQLVLETQSIEMGCTIAQLLEQMHFWEKHPEYSPQQTKVGIYNKIKPLDTILREKDRVEIYRPLVIDPKSARHLRVAKKRSTQKTRAMK